MRVLALIVGALALALGLVWGISRRKRGDANSPDIGTVSESWLAEQRGTKNDGAL